MTWPIYVLIAFLIVVVIVFLYIIFRGSRSSRRSSGAGIIGDVFEAIGDIID